MCRDKKAARRELEACFVRVLEAYTDLYFVSVAGDDVGPYLCNNGASNLVIELGTVYPSFRHWSDEILEIINAQRADAGEDNFKIPQSLKDKYDELLNRRKNMSPKEIVEHAIRESQAAGLCDEEVNNAIIQALSQAGYRVTIATNDLLSIIRETMARAAAAPKN